MSRMATCEHCGREFRVRQGAGRFCSRTCYFAHPRYAGTIIAGEEELGPQRRCTSCGEWWPNDPDFFYSRLPHVNRSPIRRYLDSVQLTGSLHLYSVCRACWLERGAGNTSRRKVAVA